MYAIGKILEISNREINTKGYRNRPFLFESDEAIQDQLSAEIKSDFGVTPSFINQHIKTPSWIKRIKMNPNIVVMNYLGVFRDKLSKLNIDNAKKVGYLLKYTTQQNKIYLYLNAECIYPAVETKEDWERISVTYSDV